jgi:hypothetical protein
MALIDLCVTSVPFSINGAAAISLIVSVTDENGKAYTGLQSANFQVRWLLDEISEQAIKPIGVEEYTASSGLPAMPGVYAIEVLSEGTTWTPARVSVSIFYIAVHVVHQGKRVSRSSRVPSDHGQTLYTPADELLPL